MILCVFNCNRVISRLNNFHNCFERFSIFICIFLLLKKYKNYLLWHRQISIFSLFLKGTLFPFWSLIDSVLTLKSSKQKREFYFLLIQSYISSHSLISFKIPINSFVFLKVKCKNNIKWNYSRKLIEFLTMQLSCCFLKID